MVFLDAGFGPIEIWVKCDGERLEEHALKTVSELKQECFIASKQDSVRPIFYVSGLGYKNFLIIVL